MKKNNYIDADVILKMLVSDIYENIEKNKKSKNVAEVKKNKYFLSFLEHGSDFFINRINKIIKMHNADKSIFKNEDSLKVLVFLIFKADAFDSFVSAMFEKWKDCHF